MVIVVIYVSLVVIVSLVLNPVAGVVFAAMPWLAAGMSAAFGTKGRRKSAGPSQKRQPEIEAMADRFRAGLDRNADMAARAYHATTRRSAFGVTDRSELKAQLLIFCQHSLIRDDVFVLADHGTTLASEFDLWLGRDLMRHLERHLLAGQKRRVVADPKLAEHARQHGWLAPSTLALARSGSPERPVQARPEAGAMGAAAAASDRRAIPKMLAAPASAV